VDWRDEKERRILGVFRKFGTTNKESIRHMEHRTDWQQSLQVQPQDVLNEILRQGARRMLATAIEQGLGEYIAAHADQRDNQGLRLVVRNGHLPQRSIQAGLGPIEVCQPRVHDRRTDAEGNRIRFTSKILLPYLRRTQAIEELIPWLYLRGISTGDYAFPAEHWRHIRTTNPIQSTFATVRLRRRRTKGIGSRTACLTMVFKLAQCAEWSWRTLNGSTLLPEVIRGVKFVDGTRQDTEEIAA
jgi:transposase-like protein